MKHNYFEMTEEHYNAAQSATWEIEIVIDHYRASKKEIQESELNPHLLKQLDYHFSLAQEHLEQIRYWLVDFEEAWEAKNEKD